MKKVNFKNIYLIVAMLIIFSGCKKDFLNDKPNQALVIPSTISDFEGLLNNYNVLNQEPYLSIVSTDDIYTTTAGYNGAAVVIKNSYLWNSDIYQGTINITDWNTPYQAVYYANVVLDGLLDFKGTATQAQINNIKGKALFYRAMGFYVISQQFAAPYQESSADQTPGIPIRLKSDVQAKSQRGTLRQTYNQIIQDLKDANDLLPTTSAYKTQPVKNAASALLARVCLIMGNYDQALSYANNCLTANNKLINYNTLIASAAKPFPISYKNLNDEVLYYATAIGATFLTSPSVTIIDSTLFNSYKTNDLRKTVFFNNKGNGVVLFKGNYTGSSGVFAGLANDELYLIRAECYARKSNVNAAMKDLNDLLVNRWKTGTYVPLSASNSTDALEQIISERRKELVYRNLRWSDLRRLNLDNQFAVTLKRVINGQTYTLAPNNDKYIFPIPDSEISASGISQNER